MAEEFTGQHSMEAEWAVLGAVMIDNARADDFELSGDDFYSKANRVIWDAINELKTNGVQFDMMSVVLRLQDTGRLDSVGGVDYISNIVKNTVPSGAKRYAAHIKDKATRRRLAVAGGDIMRLAADSASSAEALDEALSILMGLTDSHKDKGPVDIKTLLAPYIDVVDARFNRKGKLTGLATGFVDIDNRTGGLRPGNLVIIAGRPSMGKTTMALNIAENVALNNLPTLTFSMEMGADELLDKHFSSIGSVALEKIRNGTLEEDDWQRVTHAMSRLTKANMVIDDTPGLSIQDIASRARKTKRQRGLSLIVIDYLQLMTGDGNNRVEEISAISRGMKLMAKDLQVPVIALSQLNRSLEQRQNKRPIMSDLRESGAIEQDADIIMMLYRDEVYDENTNDKGIAECIFVKNRSGKVGRDGLLFDGEKSRFRSYEGSLPEINAKKQNNRGFDV